MKSVIVLLAVFAGTFCAGHALVPNRAKCAYCYTGPCYNTTMCGAGCVCLKRGLDVSGHCYSVERGSW